MKIAELIDKDVNSISLLEDTRELLSWFKERKYYAVVDEELHTTGIITIGDLVDNSARNLIDCNFAKPKLTPDQTIVQVFEVMKKSGYDYLPVYDAGLFIGVISLFSITLHLIDVLNNKQTEYQKSIHDFRNPISNIQGITSLLLQNIKEAENTELLYLTNLSCKHALDILEDVSFLELNSSKHLSLIPTEMNEFYRECVKQQQGLGLLKNIKILTDFSIEQIYINIDPNQLKRAAQNIISNAIKFSYPNSAIKVSTKVVDNKIILKVSDSGIGIPAKMHNIIFNKFTSAQRTGTNGEASSGLGLFFSKQCVEKHQGYLYFKSTVGVGTKFYVIL